MKFFLYRHFISIFVVLILAFTIWVIGFDPNLKREELFALAGAFLSLLFFTQKQALEETKLFKEIFVECNERFEELSVGLNQLLDSDGSLTDEEAQLLDSYFNLSAEEYMYYQMGYIPPMVWKAWKRGMSDLMECERIGSYWKRQDRSASHYGLDLLSR